MEALDELPNEPSKDDLIYVLNSVIRQAPSLGRELEWLRYPRNGVTEEAKSYWREYYSEKFQGASGAAASFAGCLDKELKLVDKCRKDGDMENAFAVTVMALAEFLGTLSLVNQPAMKKAYFLINYLKNDFKYFKREEDKERAFNLVFDRCARVHAYGNDIQYILISDVLLPLCPNEMCKLMLENRVDEIEDESKKQELMRKLIERFYGIEELQKYEEGTLNLLENFPDKMIKCAIKRGNYNQALKFCSEFEYDWDIDPMPYLVEISEKTPDISQKKDILKYLAIKDSDYYENFKSLHTPEEWKECIKIILGGSKENALYQLVINDESVRDKLGSICEDEPFLALKLYNKIPRSQRERVALLFVDHIRKNAEMASTRKELKEVCDMIRMYRGVFSKDNRAIKQELMNSYKSNRMFVDELRKVN
jgi:hypothetical protein